MIGSPLNVNKLNDNLTKSQGEHYVCMGETYMFAVLCLVLTFVWKQP